MRRALTLASVCVLAAFPVAANAGSGFDFSFTTPTGGTVQSSGIGVFALDMVGTSGLKNEVTGLFPQQAFPIASIELEIKGLTHATPVDLLAFLIDPFGRNVVVLDGQGGQFPVTGVDLVFNDGAGIPLPVGTQITSGIYLPSPSSSGIFSQFDNSGTDAWSLVIINLHRDNQGSGSNASFDSFTLRGTVPEPVTLSLLALGALMTLRRSRR